ncbi:MAG: glycosyltransferase [Desulfobacteraceae bacterium]|jgi:predicted glycosyltransferase|nr:glycosyltransferase [Desulfobacteraceae bacterium]
MKIIQYCQHVLGIGHLFRSLEISRALSDHEVILVSGGPPVETHLPRHVTEFRLPELQMNRAFKRLHSTQRPDGIDQVREERQKRLFALLAAEKPDVFLIELYPFGRKAFRFELDPVLQAVDDRKLSCGSVVCSVRDILVEKEDRDKHELRVVKTLNRYFNAVLVHSDPQLVKISETFDHFNQISIPVDYTGYIAPKPAADAGKMIRQKLNISEEENLIIASAGGGNVGAPILTAAVRAFSRLAENDRCHLKVFTGPFLDQSEFERLKRCAGNNVQVTRFARDFLSYLAAADLSVSMGGYNTTMNILACGTPALVWPFGQNREQRLRAGRLASLGVLQVLENEDLDPDRLAVIMDDWMSRSTRPAVKFDLNGAANTARWIENRIKFQPRIHEGTKKRI